MYELVLCFINLAECIKLHAFAKTKARYYCNTNIPVGKWVARNSTFVYIKNLGATTPFTGSFI